MKKLVYFLILVLFTSGVHAQFVTRKAKDSTSNSATKYITWTFTPDGITGVSLVGVKSTGTVSGYAILQHRIDTLPGSVNTWDDYNTDTLFLTDVSTGQANVWHILPHSGNGIRLKVVTTGTQKIYLYAAYLRRSKP